MSWHFSKTILKDFESSPCSPEPAAASLEAKSSDGEPCAPSSSTPTPAASSCNAKTTAVLIPFRCGTTFKPSTGHPGLDGWILYRVGSPARTYPQQVKAQVSRANAPDSGAKWPGSFAKLDRNSSSWKTHQYSLAGDLEPFLETWPKWGSMRGGACSAPTMPAPLTSGIESGYWPTIRSTDGDKGGRGDLIQAVRGNPNSHYRFWQTPVADDAVNRAKGKMNSRGEPKLSAQVKLWGTPRASKGMQNKLRTVSPNHNCHSRLEDQVAQLTGPGGSLNPNWVEWLMNWPVGWTDLTPLDNYEFEYWKTASATEIQGNRLRGMWFNREAGAPPPGSQSAEQYRGQRDGAMFELPPSTPPETQSCELCDLQKGVPTNSEKESNALRRFELQQGTREAISRTKVETVNRVDRLKAIGNGQVPAVAALAWRILRHRSTSPISHLQ